MSKNRLDEIESRVKAATEGPWAWDMYGEKMNAYHVGIACDAEGNVVGGRVHTERFDEDSDDFVEEILWRNDFGEHEGSVVNYGDPDFIAHSREDITYLLRIARAAQRYISANHENTVRAAVAEMRAALEAE